MTTGDIPPADYAYDEVSYERDLARSVPLDNDSEPFGNDPNGPFGTSKNGTYNVVSKDYGDHKVNYYIPKEYGDEYGISELEQMSLDDEQPLPHSSRIMQQRAYPQYDMYNREISYDPMNEMPMMSSRTMFDGYPRPMDPRMMREMYGQPPPPVDYGYDDQLPPVMEQPGPYGTEDDGLPDMIYVAEPRVSQQPLMLQQPSFAAPIVQQPVYIQPEAQQTAVQHTFVLQPPPPPPLPIQRTVVVQPDPQPVPMQHTFVLQAPPPPPQRSIVIQPPPSPPPQRAIIIQPPPSPPPRPRIIVRKPPPVRRIRRRVIVPRSPTPEPVRTTRRVLVVPRTPSPDPPKPTPRKVVVPRSPTPERRRIVRSPPPEPTPRKPDDQTLSLKDVVAQNRARRGNRIPKPKREVHEEEPYDLPTYHRDVLKNGFMVHKQVR